MAPTMKELGIDQLSVADRITLAQEIWDSIASIPDAIPVTEEVKQLLDRRIADLDARPEEALTWEEIKARIRSQG